MREYTVKIIIATHKKYQMPSDPMYLPVHVGAEGKKDSDGKELDLGYIKDNTGDNISYLNPYFCELTGLYWAWKNIKADYLGLVHYRRHFGNGKKGNLWKNILRYEDIKPYLGKIRVFVPRKRNYYIETLYSHYKNTHYSNQLEVTRQVISEKYPEYLYSYDRVIRHTYGYMFNMMIMEKDLMDQYCSWLFDILFEVGKRIDTSGLSAFQRRYYGRISEIIFNVWIDNKLSMGQIKKNELIEIPYMHMEKINWWKKGMAFLKAKFIGKKYENSF